MHSTNSSSSPRGNVQNGSNRGRGGVIGGGGTNRNNYRNLNSYRNGSVVSGSNVSANGPIGRLPSSGGLLIAGGEFPQMPAFDRAAVVSIPGADALKRPISYSHAVNKDIGSQMPPAQSFADSKLGGTSSNLRRPNSTGNLNGKKLNGANSSSNPSSFGGSNNSGKRKYNNSNNCNISGVSSSSGNGGGSSNNSNTSSVGSSSSSSSNMHNYKDTPGKNSFIIRLDESDEEICREAASKHYMRLSSLIFNQTINMHLNMLAMRNEALLHDHYYRESNYISATRTGATIEWLKNRTVEEQTDYFNRNPHLDRNILTALIASTNGKSQVSTEASAVGCQTLPPPPTSASSSACASPNAASATSSAVSSPKVPSKSPLQSPARSKLLSPTQSPKIKTK